MPMVSPRELQNLKKLDKTNRLLSAIIVVLLAAVIVLALMVVTPPERSIATSAVAPARPAPLKITAAPPYTDRDVEILAKTVWGEARDCAPEEWRLVVWTVLQRVGAAGWGDTIEAVATAKYQFAGYRASNPVDPGIRETVAAELANWASGAAPPTHPVYAPTTPYFYFDGDGKNNYFREAWQR